MILVAILAWYLTGVIVIIMLELVYYNGALIQWIEKAPFPILEYSIPMFWPLLILVTLSFLFEKGGKQ